jgi:hypothetical protein
MKGGLHAPEPITDPSSFSISVFCSGAKSRVRRAMSLQDQDQGMDKVQLAGLRQELQISTSQFLDFVLKTHAAWGIITT